MSQAEDRNGRPRVFLMQNGLRNGSTHYLQETLGWRRVLEARGHAVHIHGHASWPAGNHAGLEVVPCFPMPPDSTVGGPEVTKRLRTLIEGSGRFAAGCSAVDVLEPRRDDLIVVPYANEVEIMGLAVWGERRRQAGAAMPRAVVVVRRPQPEWDWRHDTGIAAGDASHMAYACERLTHTFGADRRQIVATTPGLAEALGRITAQPVVTGCAPMDHAGLVAPQEAASAPRYAFAFLGQLRPEKGSRRLAAIVRRYLSERGEARIAIQADSHEAMERSLDGYDTIRDDPRIDWYPGSLAPATFAAILHRADSVLLPCEPERYQMRVSGVFSDALAAGCPVVVSAPTWMSRMLRAGHGVGVAVHRPSPEVFVRALLELGALPGARDTARAKAAAWRREQSLERLVALIIEGAGAEGRARP